MLSLAQLVERPTAGEGEGSIPSGNTILLRNSVIGNTLGFGPRDRNARPRSNRGSSAKHPRSSTVEQNPYKIEVFGSNPNVDTNFGKLA